MTQSVIVYSCTLPSERGQVCRIESGQRYTVVSVTLDDEMLEPIYVFQPEGTDAEGRPCSHKILTGGELSALKPELLH